MRLRGTTLMVVIVIGLYLLSLAPVARAADKAESVIDVGIEVWALQTLRDFDLTSEQLATLKNLASNTASPLGERDAPKVTDKYVAKLTALRDALVKGQDDDEIDTLHDDVDSIQDDDDIDVDDSIAISDAAKAKVGAAMKLFTSAQLASYIAAYEDEAPDPAQSLLDAADDIRGTDDEDAKSVADDAADEVAELIAGLDAGKQKPVAEKVRVYLERVRKMPEGEFKRKHAELESAAKELVGDTDGFTILRHWLERDVAELLSNPQLPKAIEARLKAPPAADKE